MKIPNSPHVSVLDDIHRKTLNSDTERFPCSFSDHTSNSLINVRNIIISIGILIGRNIMSGSSIHH